MEQSLDEVEDFFVAKIILDQMQCGVPVGIREVGGDAGLNEDFGG